MRPVYAGFILVSVGLSQVLFGIWTMAHTPNAASGTWSQLTRWGHFSLGFTALFLGILAVRGGLWSFRKERFPVVKVGAIAATACVWALWVPWIFGLLALLIVTRAREEYYPLYDPRWDAPDWARPPSGEEVEGKDEGKDEGKVEEEAEGGAEMMLAAPEEVSARDFLDDDESRDDKEAVGLQDAYLETGDGWEDLA